MDWLFSEEFEPRLKPNEYVMIKGQIYQVLQTRPMFPWYFTVTNLTNSTIYDLRNYGLLPNSDELLDFRIKINGPSQVMFRVEGQGGDNFGGWGYNAEYADESTPEYLLEFFQLGREIGWLSVQINPIVTPAWVRMKAYGYVYKVALTQGTQQKYLTPPYISTGVSPTLR